jgi:hypothetical protein
MQEPSPPTEAAAVSPRISRFLIGLVLGALLGLGYAWFVQPVSYYDTSPDTLSEDYRTDYVLMVAQAYQSEGDLRLALIRLAALGPRAPESIVAAAKTYAASHQFSPNDLKSLDDLEADLNLLPASPEIQSP